MKFLFKQSYDDDIKLFKHSGYVRALIVFFAIAFLLPLFFIWIGADSATLKHIIQMLTFATSAMGLMVLTGFTGQVSLGHGAFLRPGCVWLPFSFAAWLSLVY